VKRDREGPGDEILYLNSAAAAGVSCKKYQDLGGWIERCGRTVAVTATLSGRSVLHLGRRVVSPSCCATEMLDWKTNQRWEGKRSRPRDCATREKRGVTTECLRTVGSRQVFR
jgi:hypothetical protein